jgi:hypothetical protein
MGRGQDKSGFLVGKVANTDRGKAARTESLLERLLKLRILQEKLEIIGVNVIAYELLLGSMSGHRNHMQKLA